jgi:hypothetical protein
MLILGNFERLRHELIPALFRIAEDRAIGHIDMIVSPDETDLQWIEDSPLCFVALEVYRENEHRIRGLPESVRDRIIVLAKPADFPAVAPEIRCACYCTELKSLLPREGASLLEHGSKKTAGTRHASPAPGVTGRPASPTDDSPGDPA